MIVIEPATPEVVYVPEYQPAVVYGPWWYPDYPPYYWPYPGAAFVNGFFWGAGIAMAAGIWGWNHSTGTTMTLISTSTDGTTSMPIAQKSR